MATAGTGSGLRRFTRYRRPPPPPFVATSPSADYLALSEIPSTQLIPSSDRSESRKLLVLDLNGTLVLRSPRTYSGPRTVMPRPFSKAFKEYIFREGSHLDVMVWSSAQPHSVDSMLGSFFGSDRSRLVGIWARDTLGLSSEHYSQKVQTVKDLNIIWRAPAGLPPPIKVMSPPPMAILTDDPTSVPGYDPTKPPPEIKGHIYTSLQLMPEVAREADETDRTGYFEIPEVKRDDPIPGLSTIGSDTGVQESVPPAGPYSALNSLLLDDSALKAHLQPYNHLTLPEYTADLRARDVKRRNAMDALSVSGMEAVNDEDENMRAGELSDAMKVDGSEPKNTGDEGTSSHAQTYKHLRAAPFDKTLLAVIGVLDAVQYESSIVGWMKAGGMRPNEEEMNRVAMLFSEESKNHPDVVEERVDTSGKEEEKNSSIAQIIPAKRSSDTPEDPEHTSPKRPRPSVLRDAEAPTLPTGGVDEVVEDGRSKSTSIGMAARDEGIAPADNETFNATTEDLFSAGKEPVPQPTKRKRHRVRQKPTYSVDHPLSANDSYPFFADGHSETKLWFQDRDIYTYWVRRGLLALKECGIEPEAGIDVKT